MNVTDSVIREHSNGIARVPGSERQCHTATLRGDRLRLISTGPQGIVVFYAPRTFVLEFWGHTVVPRTSKAASVTVVPSMVLVRCEPTVRLAVDLVAVTPAMSPIVRSIWQDLAGTDRTVPG